MLNPGDLGRLLLIVGGVVVLLWLALLLVERVPFLGRLPGDITFSRGNTTIFLPITSCVLASVVLTVLLNVLVLLFRRH